MPAVIGDLDVMLRALEQAVRAYQPRCEFFFGDAEELMRVKTPPYVAWYVRGGEAQPPREITSSTRFATIDDLVVITARCAGLPPLPQVGPDPRRQQMEASRQVFLAVQLVAHQKHQGYIEDRGWEIVGLEALAEAHVAINYTFAIRAGRLTPPLQDVQPLTQEPTVLLESP